MRLRPDVMPRVSAVLRVQERREGKKRSKKPRYILVDL